MVFALVFVLIGQVILVFLKVDVERLVKGTVSPSQVFFGLLGEVHEARLWHLIVTFLSYSLFITPIRVNYGLYGTLAALNRVAFAPMCIHLPYLYNGRVRSLRRQLLLPMLCLGSLVILCLTLGSLGCDLGVSVCANGLAHGGIATPIRIVKVLDRVIRKCSLEVLTDNDDALRGDLLIAHLADVDGLVLVLFCSWTDWSTP